MKKTLLMAALVGAVLLSAASAKAATILNFATHGVGSWNPGSALNNDAEVVIGANTLINWYNGGSAPNPNTNPTFSLAATSLGVLPTAATFGFKDELAPFVDVNASQYEYVLGKYGNVAYLFYIGNLSGNVSLPGTVGGNGLSHLVAFNAEEPGDRVPDGGATVALLGLGLVALGASRRFIKS